MRDFFQKLDQALQMGAATLATVVNARGSTPRIAGARMFVPENGPAIGTIGGGMTEGSVLALARETLADGTPRLFEADLRGKPGEVRDGICGGTMTLWLTRLTRDNAGEVVQSTFASLHMGKRAAVCTLFDATRPLSLEVGGDGAFVETLTPDPHLLVVGAGHIGRCLAKLARQLGFQVSVQDERTEWLDSTAFPPDCRLETGLPQAIETLQGWEGGRYAALVTRGFPQDVEALAILARDGGMDYVGLLGSRKRVQTVLAAHAVSGTPDFPASVLHAPVGLEIGAETPDEIAVSIAAEMIRVRRRGHRPLESKL